MTEYTVTFSTPTAYAVEDIKAKTATHALKKAHALYDNDKLALDWYPYDADCKPLDAIEVVTMDNNDQAYWQSEGATLKDAAPDLLDALQLAVKALNTVPCFSVPSQSTDSYRIAAICDRAVFKAKGL